MGSSEPRRRSARRFFAVVALVALLGIPQKSSAAQVIASSLADLSLEELGDVEIVSASKRPERLSNAPASVFVITADDIRRSGATSLPEALRLAPNLEVAQASASGYAITSRGFNSSSANKLLVLIDGRSVYTPLFAGVFWDAQDVMLEDIERIEVISGPAGTLWGTNAVNGVINIITKSAVRTQGTLIAAGGGNREIDAAARYGATAGSDGHYRIYAQHLDRDHTFTASGTARDDAWHKTQAGFRADWDRPEDSVTVEGNAYTGREGQPLPGTISISGLNLALGTISISGENLGASWAHMLQNGGNLTLKGYVDRTERTVPPTFAEALTTFDVQFQHSLPSGPVHALIWGAEFRYAIDRLTNSDFFAFLPAKVNQRWPSVFAQDELKLRPDLRLIIGARVERNDYTGTEFLPNVRLAWNLSADHLLWVAASRTVRAPSRFDRDVFVPGKPPFILVGGPDVVSETANVYELGYRGQPAANVSYSMTVFHSDYDHLRTQEIDFEPSPFIFFSNEMQGHTDGIEMWGSYQGFRSWRLGAGMTALRERLALKPGSNDTNAPGAAGMDPAVTWLLRSSIDLPRQTELDVTTRHVSALSNPVVPAYTAVDIRLAWRPRPNLELSVTGKNLFDGGHGEFTDVATRTEIGRSVFFKILSQF
jgi:iron complex outermembrane receptor protein